MQLFLIVAAVWVVALLIPKPKPQRQRQQAITQHATRQAIRQPLPKPEKLPTLPDPDEIQFLLTQREQLFAIAAKIDELPDGEKKTRKQIAIDKQIFAVDKKMKQLYN